VIEGKPIKKGIGRGGAAKDVEIDLERSRGESQRVSERNYAKTIKMVSRYYGSTEKKEGGLM